MKQIQYQTDLTGPQFEVIKPCLQVDRSSKWPLIQLLNAIFYVCGEGIKWRALPKITSRRGKPSIGIFPGGGVMAPGRRSMNNLS